MTAATIRVAFHAGFHKTGTTSLQASLAAHAAWLGPETLVETRALSKSFSKAADAARRYSDKLGPADLQALQGDLADWAAGLSLRPGQSLLASSEDFSGHMPGNLGIKDYSAAPVIAKAVAVSLNRQFGTDLRLTMLYTTRDPEAWVKSIHWQLAKHHSSDIGIGRFARLFGAAAEFNPVIEAARAEVTAVLPQARIEVASLEQTGSRRLGPVEAIYDLIDLDAGLRASLPPKPPSNQSPPYDLAESFMALNRTGMPRDLLTRVKRAILDLVNADQDTAG